MTLHDRDRIAERLRSVTDPVALLINLFTHAPVGFAVWTPDGKPLLTNKAFLDLFGSEPPPEYNVLEDDILRANGMLALFEKAFAGETVHVPTFWFDPRELTTIKVTEGRRVAISMTIFPVFGAGGAIEYVAATYKDETANTRAAEAEILRRAKEAAEAANVELEAFSYSIAHDLRAPLRAINGFGTALLEEVTLDGSARAHLDRMIGAATRMDQLIDGLLAIARISKHDLQYETVDLAKLAHELIPAGTDRRVRWTIAGDLIVRGDPVLLYSVMQNLISNAWKFTGRNADAHIEIGALRGDGPPAFFVKDNGAGFEARHADQLFKPFRRLHRASEFEGTGIGLATVHRIIRRHGGRIWCEGRVDQGATFYFSL